MGTDTVALLPGFLDGMDLASTPPPKKTFNDKSGRVVSRQSLGQLEKREGREGMKAKDQEEEVTTEEKTIMEEEVGEKEEAIEEERWGETPTRETGE